jgi:hypothetical protein
MRDVDNIEILYLAMLFHDAGKGAAATIRTRARRWRARWRRASG